MDSGTVSPDKCLVREVALVKVLYRSNKKSNQDAYLPTLVLAPSLSHQVIWQDESLPHRQVPLLAVPRTSTVSSSNRKVLGKF